jgi:Icc protein
MLICQLTDLHLRPSGMKAYHVVETNTLTEHAFRSVAALDPKPDVVLLTGDLTECGLDREYAVLVSLVRRYLDVPVFAIPGNHDNRSAMRQELKGLPGVTTDPEFIQYAVDGFPVRLVMLDTLVPGEPHGELCETRLAFLDRVLAAVPDKPTLIGMHHPPFISGIDHMDRINLRNAEAFASVLARHPQVERIVCGHHHRPVVARFGNAIASIAPSVVHQVELELRPNAPGAFIMEPPAFQLHRWTPATGVVSHIAYVGDYPGPFPFANNSDDPASP